MCEVKKFKYFYSLYLNLTIFYFAILIPTTLHGIAHAGSLYVSPVKIELSEKQKNEVINIKNDSDKEIFIQIKTVKWSQYGDNENLESTKEILIAPKIFRLKPGATQITRIGLLRNIDISKEISYRILIEEIPSLTSDKFNGLNIVLSISIPVFIMPIIPAKQNIEINSLHLDGEDVILNLNNSGLSHAKISSIELYSTNNPIKNIALFNVPTYILAESKKTIRIKVNKENIINNADLKVKIQTVVGLIESNVALQKK